MIQARNVFAGMQIDVVVAHALPEEVVQDQIIVISEMQPGEHKGAITLDTAIPESPAVGDVCIRISSGEHPVAWEDTGKRLTARPGIAQQYSGEKWILRRAYIGVGGAWMPAYTPLLPFDYTGDYEEGEYTYSDGVYYQTKLLSSGIFTAMADWTVDIFLCGAGGPGGDAGSGGGGGYTKNFYGIQITAEPYVAEIGAGGANAASGGYTQWASPLYRADGGKPGSNTAYHPGGDGGSGGGTNNQWGREYDTSGGSDGSNGKNGGNSAGAGQGTTTRPFEDALADPLGAGGAGISAFTTNQALHMGGHYGGGNGACMLNSVQYAVATDGTPNTGGGGGGGRTASSSASKGASGIIILRWKLRDLTEQEKAELEVA